MFEYVIWGIPTGDKDERLLITKIEGQKITSLSQAEKLKRFLEVRHKAEQVRIQTVNLTDNNIKFI